MDKKVIEKYLGEVPMEIRMAIMELSTDNRWAIYLALTVEGRKYFNEIKNEFDANPNTLNAILSGLIDGGLIARRINKIEGLGDNRLVFYEPTNMGKRLLSVVKNVGIPPQVNNMVQVKMFQENSESGNMKIRRQIESDDIPKILNSQRV